ncbi:hypothetical protein BGZ61DRAFT_471500 [Ilyonectria robusta]|uniref:uncharacterized protein n=1 Tax=Ilyonectria robusta TaxID=1079257 RepID=UPI001E8E347C|nr:uncharacterized protein BGZ61DRAFT_471500 [Ilyonectria robusta]KAH8738152.1 hypothetical protein BGZ61DRAFT_471500 [Ilyonectria robusta]
MFAFVPESPVYLINQGRLDQAKKSLHTLHGKYNFIDARSAHLMHVIRHENSGNQIGAGNYIDCFKETNLRRTLTVVFVLGGLNIYGAQLLVQNIYFLLIAGLPFVHILDIGIGGMGLGLFFTVASRDGEARPPSHLPVWPLLIRNFLLVVGGLYYAPGLGPIWAVAIILNFLIAWGVLSFMSVGWATGAELSSHKLRAKTQSLAVISSAYFAWFFSFITPFRYSVDSGNLGARTGFIFTGLCTIYVVMAYFVVPEAVVQVRLVGLDA